jgi:hypothetical protein
MRKSYKGLSKIVRLLINFCMISMQLLLLRNALICYTIGATKNIAKMVVQNSNFVSSSANVGIPYKQIYFLTANVNSLSMLVSS